MTVIWWLMLPSIYLLMFSFMIWLTKRADSDLDFSEGRAREASLHVGETGFITDDGDGNISFERVKLVDYGDTH